MTAPVLDTSDEQAMVDLIRAALNDDGSIANSVAFAQLEAVADAAITADAAAILQAAAIGSVL